MNAIFNFNRAGLLVQRYFMEKIQGELIFLSIMSFVFLFFRNNPTVIGITILIAGAFYAGNALKEIHAPTKRINYFMIPAMQLEKLTVSILLLVGYYFVLMLLAYVIGNVIGTALNNWLANIGFLSSGFDLFHSSPIKWKLFENTNGTNISHFSLFLKLFLVTQSLFILGGIYFKKNQVFKTLLALIAIIFVFVFAWGIELKLILGDGSFLKSSFAGDSLLRWEEGVDTAAKIFYWLLIPYLWVTAYFRLTEKEV
jgi:hypothetical protein